MRNHLNGGLSLPGQGLDSVNSLGKGDMEIMKGGLHLSGKGAAVFADKLSAAVDIDTGTMTNIFGSKHSLN